MRLSEYQRQAIRDSVQEHFGPGATAILFGSRTNDHARGGDIDILVKSDLKGETAFRLKIKTLAALERKLGERRIDLVTSDGTESEPTIVREALQKGVVI